jgi:hypothetical protein
LPLLPFPASFTKHDCAGREFRVRVFDPQLDEFVVEVIPSWRVRFRCSHCHAGFTECPPFALPYKRFVKQELLAKAQNYLAQQQADEPTTYRESIREQRVPLSCANDQNGRQLSPVTLWRWLSWLASLKHLVQRATQLVLQKDPRANLHRPCCPVPLAKVRSPERRRTLEQATLTLHAADVLYQCFGVSLITQMGTAGVLA